MKIAMGAILASLMVMSGCTSWNGMTEAHAKGYYYIVTNTHIFGVHPGVKLCKADKYGGLNCRDVKVKD